MHSQSGAQGSRSSDSDTFVDHWYRNLKHLAEAFELRQGCAGGADTNTACREIRRYKTQPPRLSARCGGVSASVLLASALAVGGARSQVSSRQLDFPVCRYQELADGGNSRRLRRESVGSRVAFLEVLDLDDAALEGGHFRRPLELLSSNPPPMLLGPILCL